MEEKSRNYGVMRGRTLPLVILMLTIAFLTLGCSRESYPYYLRLDDLRPLFITFVDSSGSMDNYQSSIRELVASSRDRFLDEIYAGDANAMGDKYFVLSWPSGESWPQALTGEPSEVMPSSEGVSTFIYGNDRVSRMSDQEYSDYLRELDEYPARIYLFYGNGGAAQWEVAELNRYVGRIEEGLIFSRAVLVAVPGSTADFLSSVEAVMRTEEPRMSAHGWHSREYDPNEMTAGAFFDDIVSIVEYR